MILQKIKKFLKFLRRIIYWVLVIILIAVIITAIVAAYKLTPVFKQYFSEAYELVNNSSASTFYTNNVGYVYSSDGTEIATLRSDGYSQYLTSDEIPQSVKDAFVAIEDKRFYSHHGVDWGSTIKSFVLLIKDKRITRGGSTITQQLVRNVFTEDIGFEKSYVRKIKEILTALCMEKKYSKDQILEYYINNINFANNYYGIGAASVGYFGKPVDELTDAEVALLCAIPNNPTYYNPRTNLKNTVTRRNIILREMYEQGYLNEEDYLVALNSSVNLAEQESAFYNYESSYAIHCATEYLMKLSGFPFQYSFDTQDDFDKYQEEYSAAFSEASHALYTKGYKVYTTLDLKVQKNAQKSLDKELKSFSSKSEDGVYKMQGAATVIDNKTGKVIACIGGRTQETSVYSYNRAFQAYMQPGSTIKPLIVYTPALQSGYNANTIVHDEPIEGGPKNSDGKYLGDITLREAVEKSRNCVAWSLFDELTPKVGLSFIQSMHFDKITPNDYFNPASLGGLYYGVTTEQMASGYATLENKGVYREPDCIAMILNSDDENLYEEGEPVHVYSSKAAGKMIDVLQGVANTGTAAGLVLTDNPEMPIACKTGTTNGGKCAWFCGVTPYYTVAVYVGRDDNKPTNGLWGSTYPKYVWADIQNYLCKGKKVKELSVYKPKKKKTLDSDTDTPTVTPTVPVTPEKPKDETETQKESELREESESENATEKEEKPKKPKPTESESSELEESEIETEEPSEEPSEEPEYKPEIPTEVEEPEDSEAPEDPGNSEEQVEQEQSTEITINF